jgi:hypothetical protein
MNPQPAPAADSLLDLVDADHERILEALDDSDMSPMDAVVWASAHLATVERTLYPMAARRLRPRSGVPALRQQAIEMERVLRLLEQRYAGDALAHRVDAGALTRELRDLLPQHIDAERQLLRRLEPTLPRDRREALAAEYRSRLEHAPTRPHPHAPHRGPFAALAFRVDALRDRILDTMDARHVPAPRPRPRRREPGQWGLYLLGGQRDR